MLLREDGGQLEHYGNHMHRLNRSLTRFLFIALFLCGLALDASGFLAGRG